MSRRSKKNSTDEIELDAAGDFKDPDVQFEMHKTIGLLSSVTIIVGSMIGSGIFVSPTGIVRGVRSIGASLVIWAACGLYSLLGALCYAELGTMIHRSGADYAYFYEAFGPFMAFLRLWIEVIVNRPATTAVIAITFAKYMLQPFYPDCDQPTLPTNILAVVSILLLTHVNCFSVKLATGVQTLFTVAKMIALFVIIGAGFYQIAMGHTSEFENAFEGTDSSFGQIVTAFYNGLFAYSGWNYLNCMIEEMKNPKRDLPIAIVISCLLVTTIYTLTIAAYATTVTMAETYHTSALAIVFARRLFGVMWWIMPVFVAFSCFGGMNGAMLTTSRIFLVAGQNKHMPQLLSLIEREKKTPIPAVLFTSATSLAYLLVGDVYQLINCLGFVQWTSIAISVFIVIFLRWRRPTATRPLKIPVIIPAIYVAFTLFLTAFSFQGAPFETLVGIGLVLTGIPVYLVCVAWKKKPVVVDRTIEKITRWCQLVCGLVESR